MKETINWKPIEIQYLETELKRINFLLKLNAIEDEQERKFIIYKKEAIELILQGEKELNK